MFFGDTEKTLLSEIKALKSKIDKLIAIRKNEITLLNKELKLGFNILRERQSYKYFDTRYYKGKLTPRGEEVCYLLFDCGLSNLAVAYVLEMKLTSARNRFLKWSKLGGINRPKIDFNFLPRVVVPSPY